MSGIPVPNAGGKKEEYTSICELYDGDASTAGVCSAWITKTQTCTKRSDELGQNCDGCGNFPALGK
jgi:hypothetical protein